MRDFVTYSGFACIALSAVLSLFECIGKPPHAMCDCKAFKGRTLVFYTESNIPHGHHNSLLLFVNGAASVLPLILPLLLLGRFAFPLSFIWGVYMFYRWWIHTKTKRKKMLEKALGVVRATAAGLKVVPVAGAAFLALTLMACGEQAPAGAPEPNTPEDSDAVFQIVEPVIYPDGSVYDVPCLQYEGTKKGGISCDWDRRVKRP